MNDWRNRLPSLRRTAGSMRGQTLVEYALVLLLIVIVLIVAVSVIGSKTNRMYSTIGSSVPQTP
jgi:Flp pilus assembly pilin Flp